MAVSKIKTVMFFAYTYNFLIKFVTNKIDNMEDNGII